MKRSRLTFTVPPNQGCDDGAYFEIQDVALVIRGRSNLLIVARALKTRLATPEAIKHFLPQPLHA